MSSNKTINKTPYTIQCLYGSESSDIKGVVGNSYHAGLAVNAEGYGTFTSDGAAEDGAIVYLENDNGTLRLHVYADINSEDPTHTINLEQAKLSNRQEVAK